MRILVLPADLGGCGHYRLIFAAEHLKALGHDIYIEYPAQGTGFPVKFEGDKMTDFELPCENPDVVVMQRISHAWHAQLVPLFEERGLAVVVDMDDDLSTIHPQNQAFHMYRDRNLRTPFSYKTAFQICNAATLVTVSTKRLLNVYTGKKGHGHVLDNYVPERYLDIYDPRDLMPKFGWAGMLQSHPADLIPCRRAIKELVKMGHDFMVVGPADPKVRIQLGLDNDPPATGVLSQFAWPTGVAKLDVGLAPLEMSAFNESKSRLKILEYNSVGVPYVASPRTEYRRFHKESGGGLLAETPKEWVASVNKLMKDEILRKELAEQGKAFATTQTIEQNSWRFLEAWTRAYELKRGGK